MLTQLVSEPVIAGNNLRRLAIAITITQGFLGRLLSLLSSFIPDIN